MAASIGGALTASVTPLRARTPTNRLHLQDCRIAGSHYYDCYKVLAHLRISDVLRLSRQPENPHDERAIEVFWREHKLGYLPRPDNAAAASLADRAHALHAEIIGIDDPDEEWEPVRLRVWVVPT
ncbi:MAG TPA: HIRAN domain-containing protein [Rhodanobacteraceae bacterium]|nr:HIRAN domain-containing protein [Rhodanobacteraceae bacterium]